MGKKKTKQAKKCAVCGKPLKVEFFREIQFGYQLANKDICEDCFFDCGACRTVSEAKAKKAKKK